LVRLSRSSMEIKRVLPIRSGAFWASANFSPQSMGRKLERYLYIAAKSLKTNNLGRLLSPPDRYN